MEQHTPEFSFLAGGGEIGALINTRDWSQTPLGTPDTWPQSLRTTLSILLNSRFPMFLFWGPQHLCFYNDAYRPSLGENGRHPMALGMPGAEAWPDIWPDIQPLVSQVLAGGPSTYSEDKRLPIFRNGVLDEVYWTASYSPITDEKGDIAGVFVACFESTHKVRYMQQETESRQQLEFAIEATELGTWDLNPVTGKFVANARLKEWFGLKPEDEIPLQLAIDVIVESDRERVAAAIAEAMQFSSGGLYETEYTILHPETAVPRIVRAKGRAWFGADQTVYRFNGTLQDITRQALTLQRMAESQRQLLSLFEQSPVAIAIIDKHQLTFRMANPFYGQLVGRTLDQIIGKPMLEALPEIAGQGFDKLLEEVIATGIPYVSRQVSVDLKKNEQISTVYVDLAYQPYRGISENIEGVLVIATDVTEQVEARAEIEEREAKFRTLIEQAPFATALYVGTDLIIDTANDAMIHLWGKTPAVIGMRLEKALPELEGQPFVDLLQEVMRTGVAYHAKDQHADLVVDGKLQRFWFNFTYKPLRNAAGEIYAILNMAVDVSEQVQARQQIEEAETRLLGAIELAELGTWTIDIQGGKIIYSERLKEWLGVEGADLEIMNSPRIHPRDRQRVGQAMAEAIAKGGSGKFNQVYTIIHHKTGYERIIHALGQAVFDAQGNALYITGTAQDVTIQQQLQLALTQKVQERTEELAATNEELQATNEELAEANQNLRRSNEELAQYAYVASHDLQEPLRKIQVFSGMLGKSGVLTDKDQLAVGKIIQSAFRMSNLIRDLLEFSNLTHTDSLALSVNLTEVAQSIEKDFELIISEKNAVIRIDPLPTIEATPLRMNQLFYNLIGNALKFTLKERQPQIYIQASTLTEEQLEPFIKKPLPFAKYYRISIADNGIGFEADYAEHIFEVFKRLHTRDTYSGSGIGLALCRRIVANMGGVLYAESVVGEGSVFHIILPDKQTET